MLNDEEQIKHNGEKAESKFGGIAKQGIPVI